MEVNLPDWILWVSSLLSNAITILGVVYRLVKRQKIATWLLVVYGIAVVLIDLGLVFNVYDIRSNPLFLGGNVALLTLQAALFVYYYMKYENRSVKYEIDGFQVPFFDTYIEEGTINLSGKFSIIFVDDDLKDRQKGQVVLQDYQQRAVLPDLPNIRLVEDFDIIVCDIRGVGRSPGGGNKPKEKKADSILKQIKEFYPYKYVIAISNDSGSLREVEKIADKTVVKLPDSFANNLESVIQAGINEMSRPQTYWEKIEKQLTDNHTPEKKILNYKQAYALHLYRKRIVNR